MTLWVPPKVAKDLLGARQEQAAALAQQVELHKTFDEWNRELRAIDKNLQLVKAPPGANYPGLKPGYWHVVRDCGDAPPRIIVHEDPETGEYRDPDSSLLERLRKGDMWSNRSMYEASQHDKRLQEAAERRRAQERHDRVEEVMERYDSSRRLSVGIP